MTPVLAQRLGTDRSFERLYRKHAGDVYRYALVVLRNEADAEDVTQTTFLNAYRAIEKGERPRAPQNWLITIAHNVCRQRFRQSQRRPNEVSFEEELAEAPADESEISADDIRRALGHLAFNQRAAIVMRELEGRSYQEIAEILGVSVSAVETLIFRARRALREQLEEGITCHEAEFSISRQLDGRLPRKERGALRAHLRECEECAAFARSQRAQRGALKSLAVIPLPQSLVGLFGGGGGAAVGTGIAIKATAIGVGALMATGVGYEGVKHGIWKAPASSRTAAVKQKAPATNPVPFSASTLTPAVQANTDQKLYRPAAVKARHKPGNHGKSAVASPARLAAPATHKEISPLPPSRGRLHDLKPTKPVKPEKARGHGQGQGQGEGRQHRPPPPAKPEKPTKPVKHDGNPPPVDETIPPPPPGNGHGNKPTP